MLNIFVTLHNCDATVCVPLINASEMHVKIVVVVLEYAKWDKTETIVCAQRFCVRNAEIYQGSNR